MEYKKKEILKENIKLESEKETVQNKLNYFKFSKENNSNKQVKGINYTTIVHSTKESKNFEKKNNKIIFLNNNFENNNNNLNSPENLNITKKYTFESDDEELEENYASFQKKFVNDIDSEVDDKTK